MSRLSIEDPNIVTEFNKETGEYLLSGMGELHLEIAAKALSEKVGETEIAVSTPLVSYREIVTKNGKIVRSRSADKRNEFLVQVEPLEDTGKEEKSTVWMIDENKNQLENLTEDFSESGNARDAIVSGFEWACKAGPLCEQPMKGVRVRLLSANISVDSQSHESTQVMKAVGRAIFASFLSAKPTLLEPFYRIEITVPPQFVGECSRIVTRRRGKITISQQKNSPIMTIKGFIPVAESLGLATELRSATSGKTFWQSSFDHWAKTPKQITNLIIKESRSKKGLPPAIPKPEDFAEIEIA